MVQPVPVGEDVVGGLEKVLRWSHLLHKCLEGRVGDAKSVVDHCSLLHRHGARIIPAFSCRIAARKRLAWRRVDAEVKLGQRNVSANTEHIVRWVVLNSRQNAR